MATQVNFDSISEVYFGPSLLTYSVSSLFACNSIWGFFVQSSSSNLLENNWLPFNKHKIATLWSSRKLREKSPIVFDEKVQNEKKKIIKQPWKSGPLYLTLHRYNYIVQKRKWKLFLKRHLLYFDA